MVRSDELSDDVEFGLTVPAAMIEVPGNAETAAGKVRIMEAIDTRPPLPPVREAVALVDALELEDIDGKRESERERERGREGEK